MLFVPYVSSPNTTQVSEARPGPQSGPSQQPLCTLGSPLPVPLGRSRGGAGPTQLLTSLSPRGGAGLEPRAATPPPGPRTMLPGADPRSLKQLQSRPRTPLLRPSHPRAWSQRFLFAFSAPAQGKCLEPGVALVRGLTWTRVTTYWPGQGHRGAGPSGNSQIQGSSSSVQATLGPCLAPESHSSARPRAQGWGVLEAASSGPLWGTPGPWSRAETVTVALPGPITGSVVFPEH